MVPVCLTVNVAGYIYEITLHQACKLLRWITVHGYSVFLFNELTSPAWNFIFSVTVDISIKLYYDVSVHVQFDGLIFEMRT